MRKNYISLLVVVVLLLLILVDCQRGGGRSRSRSSRIRSWGRSRSNHAPLWPVISRWIWGQNATNTTNQEQVENEDRKPNSFLSTLCLGGGILGIVFVILRIFYLNIKQNFNDSENATVSDPSKISAEIEAEGTCELSQQERNQLIEKITGEHKLKMLLEPKNQSQKFTCQLKVSDFKKITDFIYSVTFNGTDEIGRSTLCGRVFFVKTYMRFHLNKYYENRREAGQTGAYSTLLYKGKFDGKKFSGDWFYKGFENSSQYSGTWHIFL